MIIRGVEESAGSVEVSVGPDLPGKGGGGERFSLSPGEWKRLNRALGYDPAAGLFLSPGQPVDEETYDRIRAAHERTAALRDAANLLSYSDRSRSALFRRLRERGHSPDAAEHAVSFLEKKGVLDDGAACLKYAESAVRSKNVGKRRIVAYLVSHGFSKEDAVRAARSVDPEDYRAALIRRIRKNHPGLTGDPAELDRSQKQKAIAALLRQGFSADEIRSALRDAPWDALPEGED
ncbi:MAG: hypothetical protein E7576_05535 [Ruminococcaceae bacterium]|jgi:regulatory protein|nr:hypothetical protein [Oscillospiraceae bacterium]